MRRLRMVTIRRLALACAGFGIAAVVLPGCSESACENATREDRPTHACYVENHKLERETKELEYGSLHAAEQAEHEDQVEDEVEEVEEVIKQRRAEEVASALEGR